MSDDFRYVPERITVDQLPGADRVAAAEAEVEKLTRERDEWKELALTNSEEVKAWRARKWEVEKLREALRGAIRELAECRGINTDPIPPGDVERAESYVRERGWVEGEAQPKVSRPGLSLMGMGSTRRPWRRCSACRGVCHFHDTDWVCEGCGSEWNADHDPKFDAPALADTEKGEGDE
jgi:hypothetical protein